MPHSSLLVSSARCLHMLQGIIFTCLICSPGRCDSFYGSTVLGRQLGKGSKQSVPYPNFEWKFRHIVFFILVFVEVPQGIRNTK
ncbi:hypothetical protein ACFX1S_043817 [Malus domestica]